MPLIKKTHTALLRYILHVIKLTNLKCSLMSLTNAYSHVTNINQDTEQFHFSKKSPCAFLQLIPFLVSQLLETTDLFCYYAFAFSRISYKWNRIGSSILCLTSFIYHNPFEIHTCTYQQLSLFIAE